MAAGVVPDTLAYWQFVSQNAAKVGHATYTKVGHATQNTEVQHATKTKQRLHFTSSQLVSQNTAKVGHAARSQQTYPCQLVSQNTAEVGHATQQSHHCQSVSQNTAKVGHATGSHCTGMSFNCTVCGRDGCLSNTSVYVMKPI